MSVREYLSPFLLTVSRHGLIVDANLLLLFAIGKFSPELISRFKRTAMYAQADFEMIQVLISSSAKVMTTPHILTEVSDLAGSLTSPLRENFHRYLSGEFLSWMEIFNPAVEISLDSMFPILGLADIGIIQAARQDNVVLTDDSQLLAVLLKRQHKCISLSQLRNALLAGHG